MSQSKKKIIYQFSIILITVFSIPILSYFLRISPLEIFNQRWDKERIYASILVTREGFNESYNQIPHEEKKIINDSGELTVKEMTEMTNSFISLVVKKDGVVQEFDRIKARQSISMMITKIKSYNKRYESLFQTTAHRLETIKVHI